jgi:hydroxymethylpyrimidine/phosphomethylpyrimidine kinase
MNNLLMQPTIWRYVLVKGGDMPDSSDAVDVLFDGIFE